ncbi:aspartic proteinase CDR1 [Nymphaea colorata]|nr:aspartic proteinase CDR1 [Nymphaea colorata]
MAGFSSASHLLLQLLLLAVLPSPTSIFTSKSLGFSIDLIHRDSSVSPLYDLSFTLAQRAKQFALRSMLHCRRIASLFAKTTSMISSPVMPGSGEYLMKLSLGTPSPLYWATLDTGSDLIWTTCCTVTPAPAKHQCLIHFSRLPTRAKADPPALP